MSTTRRAAPPLAAYVLHHYDWSETSLILDVFTRERGRLAVAAKGAKRPYSQLRSVLLPFQRIHLSLGRTPEGEAEVHNLRGAEWAGGAPMLGGASLFSGFYLNELLMKMLARQDPHSALFDAYDAALPLLTSGSDTGVQAALRAFEIFLLKEVGLLPELGLVTLTQLPVEERQAYALHPEAGVTPARTQGEGVPGDVLLALQAAIDDGSGFKTVQAACVEALTSLKPVLRTLLHYHLGSPVLRTRQVMSDVRKLIA